MGITIRQQLAALADTYEQKELRIEALQEALLRMVMHDNECPQVGCSEFQSHPAPWHSEKCGCAIEARNLYLAVRDTRDKRDVLRMAAKEEKKS